MILALKCGPECRMAVVGAATGSTRGHAMMGGMAIRLFGALLVASIGLLILAGPASAHSPLRQEREQASHRSTYLQHSEATALAGPSGCVREVGKVVSASALLGRSVLDRREVHRGDPQDCDFNFDCCGAACHAALGDGDHLGGGRRLLAGTIVLTGASFLRGKGQGPPKPPPRPLQ